MLVDGNVVGECMLADGNVVGARNNHRRRFLCRTEGWDEFVGRGNAITSVSSASKELAGNTSFV